MAALLPRVYDRVQVHGPELRGILVDIEDDGRGISWGLVALDVVKVELWFPMGVVSDRSVRG